MSQNQSAMQKSFLSLFPLLVICDFAAQLAITMQVVELQPLVSIWMGPLDDIFYGICGIQAVYYLLDPTGKTRDEGQMSTTATVKKCAALLAASSESQQRLEKSFALGGVRTLLTLSAALSLVVLACVFSSVEVLTSLRLVLQAHLGYFLPVSAMLAGAMATVWGVKPGGLWLQAFLGASAVLLVSAAIDGRMENYIFHLFAALSNLQAWGVTASWIGVASASRGTPSVQVGLQHTPD